MSDKETENNADEPLKTPESGQDQADIGQNSGENSEKTSENQPPELAPTELTPEEKIAELEAKLTDANDQFLRKAAEFENFRKRMNQEKASAIEYANQNLLLDIIPIIDDFERAIAAGEASQTKTPDMTAFLEGVKMIEKRLTAQLESKWGLKRYISAGQPFDPNLHEALYSEKSPNVSEPTVEEDLFKGYTLKDRVIRAAKVKVLMPEDE